MASMGWSPPPPAQFQFWALHDGPSGLDEGFLNMLRAAAFLTLIWVFGRVMTAIQLPHSLGALMAGILLGPEALGVVPYASKTCASQDTSQGVVSKLTRNTVSSRRAALLFEPCKNCALNHF